MAKRIDFRCKEYTVGWLCALPVELAAAKKMLDDEHGNISPDRTNNYTLGRIGRYNVVIACLPKGQIGSIPAAAVFTHMKTGFPAIRHWLLVGVGGGVPSPKADVRLGDVVVSSPSGGYGGVVQYDLGKSYPGGRFKRTGYLNPPSQTLLSTVSVLEAKWRLGESEFSKNVSRLDSLANFAREKAGPDYLFRADSHHPEIGVLNETSATCETSGMCSKHKIVARKPRDPRNKVVVHYGTIASGDQVIKDAKKRDEISTSLDPDGVLCFEMEAAGLMNDLQCLVIRGICDYADSHKNKQWQPYAAKMAAAYARELVSLIPTQEVAKGVPEEKAVSTPKSLVSGSETSKTIRPSSTALSPAGSSSDIISAITGSKFNGATCFVFGTKGSNITVSNPTTAKTAASKPEVSNKLKRKKSKVWVDYESFEEDEEEEEIFCYNCGRPGVIAPNCGCHKSRQIHCYNCKRPGVIAPDCKCRDLCYDCGEEGHWKGDEECRLTLKRYKPRSRSRYEEDEPFPEDRFRSYSRSRYRY